MTCTDNTDEIQHLISGEGAFRKLQKHNSKMQALYC